VGAVAARPEAVTGRDRLGGLDPRTRLVGAAALVATVAALDGLPALGAAVVAAGGLALLAGWRPGALARRLGHVEGIVAAFLILLPAATPGAPLLPLGPLSPTAEGLRLAAALALRVAACALVALALLATVDPARLGAGLARLGAPERFARLFLLAARFVSLIRDEIARARAAMRVRGFRGGASRHALRSYGWLVGMTLVRALDRAERVGEAMRLRGGGLAAPRAATGGFGRTDAAFALGAGMAAAAALALDRAA
jgi:cobalt/nickel transport system permease protein